MKISIIEGVISVEQTLNKSNSKIQLTCDIQGHDSVYFLALMATPLLDYRALIHKDQQLIGFMPWHGHLHYQMFPKI